MAQPATTERPTPPTPMMATESPGRTWAALMAAPTPFMTAQPTGAVASTATSLSSGRTICSSRTTSRAQVNVPTLAGGPKVTGGARKGDPRHPRSRAADRVALHPGHHDVVALFDVRHVFAGGGDDAGRLVAEDDGYGRVGAVELVQLRVADAGGELPDQDLARAGVRQVDVVDDHGLSGLDEDGGRRLHSAGGVLAWCRRGRGGGGASILRLPSLNEGRARDALTRLDMLRERNLSRGDAAALTGTGLGVYRLIALLLERYAMPVFLNRAASAAAATEDRSCRHVAEAFTDLQGPLKSLWLRPRIP